MHPWIVRCLAGAAALACLHVPSLAASSGAVPALQPALAPDAAEVSVREVRVAQLRPGAPWLEVDVRLAVAPGRSGARHADRVRVVLRLAYETASVAGERAWRGFQAEAEAVSLAVGSASVRFYLPPEVVERDRVRAENLHHWVELVQEGATQPTSQAAVSTLLRTDEARARFVGRLGDEFARNSGILVPQHLSPFAGDPGRPAPTFVRGQLGGR